MVISCLVRALSQRRHMLSTSNPFIVFSDWGENETYALRISRYKALPLLTVLLFRLSMEKPTSYILMMLQKFMCGENVGNKTVFKAMKSTT